MEEYTCAGVTVAEGLDDNIRVLFSSMALKSCTIHVEGRHEKRAYQFIHGLTFAQFCS